MVTVTDNAISDADFQIITNHFIKNEPEVPYMLSNNLVDGSDDIDDFQFVHPIVKNQNVVFPFSLEMIQPVLDVLNPYVLLRAKINITHRSESLVEKGWHIDAPDAPDGVTFKSALLYMNTCDGYTRFASGKKVISQENRLVVFDANEEHTGTTCTNDKFRAVLNVVYL